MMIQASICARARCWRALMILAMLFLWALPGAVAAQSGVALVVPVDQRVEGPVSTVSQSIEVFGEVMGDVTSWSGDIMIHGHVGGDVVSYAGRVILSAQARVDGSLLAFGGAMQMQPGAQVGGQALGAPNERRAMASLIGLFVPHHRGSTSDGSASQVVFGVVLSVFLMAFSLLWGALWPRRTTAVTLMLRTLPGRSLSLGLLTTGLLVALLPPFAGLLSMTLVGLPVLVALLALLQAPYIYGLTVLVHMTGTQAMQADLFEAGPNRQVVLAAALMALVVGLVAALLPLAGLALCYLIASPGLGAAILSRGGLAAPR